MAICKFRHRQLGIGVGIGSSICIGIVKILFSAYEQFFEKMNNTPKYSIITPKYSIIRLNVQYT